MKTSRTKSFLHCARIVRAPEQENKLYRGSSRHPTNRKTLFDLCIVNLPDIDIHNCTEVLVLLALVKVRVLSSVFDRVLALSWALDGFVICRLDQNNE